MTNLLLLHPRYDEDSQLLWQAATSRGWHTMRALGYSVSTEFPKDMLAIYGGALWGAEVARQVGVELLSPDQRWLERPELYPLLRRSVRSFSLGAVRGFGLYPCFVKALDTSGMKQFESRVYHSADDLPDLDDSLEVLVSEPVEWEWEFRAFVLNGQAVTISPYAKYGEVEFSVPAGVGSEALEYLKEIEPMLGATLPVACVVDVGLVRGRGWAVIEANPAWCSGIYGCDPNAVLDVVKSCVRLPS